MAGLDGSVKVPVFGEVPKKTALLVGGGIALLVGIMYYRGKKASAAAASVAAAGSSEINPATGFAYGSPEDAAAMAAQAAYVTPGGVGTGGGGSPGQPTGFTSNGQWAQAAEQYMQAEGLIAEPTALASALGKYITGRQANALDQDLIHQAIAFQGFPPISGPNGYPPSINTSTDPVPTPPPTQTPPAGKLPAPTGFRNSSPGTWKDSLMYEWNAVPGAVDYEIHEDGGSRRTGNTTGIMRYGLIHNGTYWAQIAAIDSNGVVGNWTPLLKAVTKN